MRIEGECFVKFVYFFYRFRDWFQGARRSNGSFSKVFMYYWEGKKFEIVVDVD